MGKVCMVGKKQQITGQKPNKNKVDKTFFNITTNKIIEKVKKNLAYCRGALNLHFLTRYE